MENETRAVSIVQAFPQCRTIFEKWNKCIADHPVSTPTSVVCEKFAVLLGWCVTLSLCSRDARDLESCCGGVPELTKCPEKRCREESARLDRCMKRFT